MARNRKYRGKWKGLKKAVARRHRVHRGWSGNPPATLLRLLVRAIAARKSSIAGAAILVAFGALFGWVVINTI